MVFLFHLSIAIISLILIVLACVFFTNAIEFLGNKLKLGNSATGSILAVVGTGLPETVIPVIALAGASFGITKLSVAQDIAQGAIIGSPFILLTLALFLLSIVLFFKKEKELKINHENTLRNFKYFILAYFIALIFAFNYLSDFKILGVILLLVLYCIFVKRTIIKSRCCCVECECEKLFLNKINLNENLILFIQLAFSLLILILSSHFFVNEIKFFSNSFNVSPIILSLIVTPFATELPEIINSIIWLKQNKDELAMANILGAIVFQTTILFSLGLIFTNWAFSKVTFLNMILSLMFSMVFYFWIAKNKKITALNLAFGIIIYLSFMSFLLLN